MNYDIYEYNIDVNIVGVALGCENCICIPYTNDESHISSFLDASSLIWSNLVLKNTNEKIGKILFRIVKIHPHYKNNRTENNNNIKIFIVSEDILEFVRKHNCNSSTVFSLNFSSIQQDVKDAIRDHLYLNWYKVPIVKFRHKKTNLEGNFIIN